MKGYTELRVKFHLGELPGNQVTDWWMEKDWIKWRKYVEKLKRTGEYGKEVESVIFIKDHPIFESSGIVLDIENIEMHEFKPLSYEMDISKR